MTVRPDEHDRTPDAPRAEAPAANGIVDRARVASAVARIDRVASVVLDAPANTPMPELRAALAHGSVPDAVLASTALQLLREDHKSSVAPALVNCIEEDACRSETARQCSRAILEMRSDKWAFKFALALEDEFLRLTCGHAAIAYIVELGIRSYATSCLRELQRATHPSDYEDDFFTHALYQRGGRALVERWLGWQRERAEEVMRGAERRSS